MLAAHWRRLGRSAEAVELYAEVRASLHEQRHQSEMCGDAETTAIMDEDLLTSGNNLAIALEEVGGLHESLCQSQIPRFANYTIAFRPRIKQTNNQPTKQPNKHTNKSVCFRLSWFH
jgi:hypothetical protein